ncbi:MAG: ABC transporter permease [Actinomycetota bacterium]|jgi:ABC-type dipeptide/oligopeptide/nickel transport system permease component|nr:ABC transporter permease [Actinomycetota bacterium]
MKRYILARLAIVPFLLFGIVTVAFIISRLIPADPLTSIVGERAMGNPEVIAAAKSKWGLDKSVPEQYWAYLSNLVRGDLGTSFRTKNSVVSDLAERIPATLELAVTAMIIGGVGGVLLGKFSARRKDRPADHAARVFALVGSSLPVFWTGLAALFLLYARLGVFPGPGRLPSRVDPPPQVTGFYTIDALLDGDVSLFWQCLARLILPAAVLGWAIMGSISRLVRASMLDEMHSDYVRTARAKGLRERAVMRGHVLRNALLPVLTIVGFSFATLLTGAVLTETIFEWNGVGSYAVAATRNLDYPAINAVCLFGGVVFLLSNLATDLLYALADPKVRLT